MQIFMASLAALKKDCFRVYVPGNKKPKPNISPAQLAIVIASCAGLILGFGFLFPGTYTRKQSFLRAAKDAMKICISLVPIFIVAAFFESYITHLMSNTFDKDPGNIGL